MVRRQAIKGRWSIPAVRPADTRGMPIYSSGMLIFTPCCSSFRMNVETDAASSASAAAGEADQPDGLDDHTSPSFVGKGKGRAIHTGGMPRPHKAAQHERGQGLPPSADAVMPGAEGRRGDEGVEVDCGRSMAGRSMLRTWNAMGERVSQYW